jgi:hypothetical protein
MGNKQAVPVSASVPAPAPVSARSELPILNLRNINPSGNPDFWTKLLLKYPIKNHGFTPDQMHVFHRRLFHKLSTYYGFLHVIHDIYAPEEPRLTIKEFKAYNASTFRSWLAPDVRTSLENPNMKIFFINTSTGEGLEPGRIDEYLSKYGNALVHGCRPTPHSMLIRKEPDGNYYFIDPHGGIQGSIHLPRMCPIIDRLEGALPPGKTLTQSQCAFQGQRGICVLWSVIFMCYPDLTLKDFEQIIKATFERTLNRLPTEAKKVAWKFILDKDLYALAVIEDFLMKDNLRELDAMTPEQRLQLRKTAGRRRKRSKKSRRR